MMTRPPKLPPFPPHERKRAFLLETLMLAVRSGQGNLYSTISSAAFIYDDIVAGEFDLASRKEK